MGAWRECLLGDIVTFQRGYDLPKTKMNGGIYPVVASNGIIGYHDKFTTEEPGITIGRSGSVGKPLLIKGKSWSHNTTLYIKEYKDVDPFFIYYFLKTLDLKNYAGGSAVPTLNRNHIHGLPVKIPVDISEQKQIASVLSVLDDKIELNNKINKNLEEQAQAVFKSWFVDFKNSKRVICRADEFFDISIGKTPPRKETEWFSTDNSDVKWISISDMGNCGMYINNSSEYLTKQAIEKFNIKVVPKNTVLLSFKLTVGRVAIANDDMATNEAIAHFKTDKEYIIEYLYFYLKNFNFQSLGSTSSIATAVNSKIIKNMPFVIPTINEITRFHEIASSLFNEISKNISENNRLSALRDALLPELMNGKIDVSEIRI